MRKAVAKRAVHKVQTKAAPALKRTAAQVPLLFSILRKHGAIILGLTLLVVFVHDVFGTRGYLAMRRSQQEVQKLREEIAAINAENQKASDQIKALKSDPKLIERIAREQMGMMRPGERIYRIAPSEEGAVATSVR